MEQLLKQKEELNLLKNKYNKKLFLIESELIKIEKEMTKFNEEILLDTLTLSEQQKQIVNANEKNILVIACPGAGKTHTLISRYANLVLKHDVKPESVLLITFTKKAGQEMQKRLEDIIPDKLPFHVGSLHGLCYRILQKYNNINYTVLDEYETRDLIRIESNNILDNDKLNLDLETITLLKSKITSIIEQVSLTYPLNFKTILKKLNLSKHLAVVNQIYKSFAKRKKQENLIDFNDLMILFCDFLKSSKSQEFINSINYIFFDEYQDINPIQNYILSVFKDKTNIMVVGDDAQSIYSFRGSSVDFILSCPYQKYLLVENYRSTPSIVNFCENIIKNNTNQFEKNVKSVQLLEGIKPDIHGFKYQKNQYEWIINDIIRKVNNGVKLSQMVILARKNDLITQIELELLQAKIAYVKQLGTALLDKPHVKDFLAFIIILFNPKSSIHFKRIISLHKGWNINTANQLVESTTDIMGKIKELNDPQLNQLINLYNILQHKNTDLEIANEILKYIEKLKKNEDMISDIRYLLSFLKNSSLKQFITNLYLSLEIQTVSENVLFLSTVHGAKGLEWEHVYLIDVNDTDFPAIRNNQYFIDELNEIEEERRLFYVACSRAKKFLTITYCSETISPFIYELNKELYLANNVECNLVNYKTKELCSQLKNINVKEKILNSEWNIPLKINKMKIRYIINKFMNYLIQKIIYNNYPDKIKNFDLNLIHKNQNFPQKIYHDYIDNNNHWSNLLDIIFFISSYLIENKNTNNLNEIKEFLLAPEQFLFYKEIEQSIKKLVEMFKPKNIKFENYLMLDDILIDIKSSQNEVCTLDNICKILEKNGNKEISKICIYNIENGIINILDF